MAKSLEKWKEEIATQLERALSRSENDYLDKLTDLLDELDLRGTLYAKNLHRLSEEVLIKEPDPAAPLTNGLWLEAPRDEYSLWQYVALIFDDREIELPDFLKPSANIAELRSEIGKRVSEKENRRWRNRLANLSHSADPFAVSRLYARLALQGRSLRWEARTDETEDYLPLAAKDMGAWLEKDFGFLDRFQPTSLPLCALFQDYYRSTKRVQLSLEKSEDCALLNILIRRADTRDQIVSRFGETLTLSSQRLVWHGSDQNPADGNYHLGLALSDGEPAPQPLTYLPGQQPLYLHRESVYEGPPLLEADGNPNATFPISQAALESPEGLLFLRNYGLPLPTALQGKVVGIPLEVRLDCSLQTDSDAESIVVRVTANSRDGGYGFTLTEEGWTKTAQDDAEAASDETDTGIYFELPPYAGYIDFLGTFELEESESGEWRRPISYEFPLEFRRWIQNVPGSVQIEADEEIESLVDGASAGRYSLEIKPSANPDWFDVKLNAELSDTSLDEREKALLLKSKGEYVRLPGKGWRRFAPQLSGDQGALIQELGIDESAVGESTSFHAIQLAEAKLEALSLDELAQSIRKQAKLIGKQPTPNLPKGIKTELRPYQVDGFRFLAFLSQNRFGGVLADDMGLGKTLQSLTWLTWLKHRHEKEEKFQCLVICPKSVLHVWRQEIERHCSLLSSKIFDSNPMSPQTWAGDEADVLVANYAQLRIHAPFFNSVPWDVCILDEAQNIKNPQSQTAKIARSLKAEHRLALTGTPIENRALDLWSIFGFAMPGLLGSQTSFKRQYAPNKADTPARLSNRVRHFMIRRRKSQVARDLPERIEETITCQMEDQQRELYDAELARARRTLQSLESEADFNRERFNVLTSLLRLRQICCHPGLVNPAYRNWSSAKLEALLGLVAELQEEGHKILIFSQFVDMLEIIADELKKMDCRYLMLTGKTKNREELVDQFQTDTSQTVFLLSLRAAGSGLNLTAATYVALYDPWWNPAVEAQAIDRTHRIGQSNPVNAYRIIASGTVEDKIQSLQLQKEALANEIVSEETLQSILDTEKLKLVLGA